MKIMQMQVGAVCTNCYIVYDENTMQGAVVDPGDNPKDVLSHAQDAGVKITHILLTHGHFDHILGVHEIKEKTGAKLVIHADDTWLLKPEAMGMFRQMAKQYVEDTPDVLAQEGTTVKIGGLTATYLHTPGHTPGSCCIQIGEVLFTGDTMFRHECGRCDLEGGDFPTILKSLKRLALLEGDLNVLPGHEGLSTLSEERAHNPYIKQAMA